MSDSIAIKGISQGILATLPEGGEWSDLMPKLVDLISQKAAFFKGAQLVLDSRTYPISSDDLADLVAALDAKDVRLVGVLSLSEATLNQVRTLGLATDLADITPPTRPTRESAADTQPDPSYADEEINSEEYGTQGVLIKRTLRSGRTIRSQGHVVVIGDVNSGAEIIATGDVIIWGKLRGKVHAGAAGDASAVVCALDLMPVQLRIADLITVPPQETRRQAKPEMACINNGQIEAIAWLA